MQLREGEEDELRSERRRLQNAERIYSGLQEVMELLTEDAQAADARFVGEPQLAGLAIPQVILSRADEVIQ